MDLLTAKSLKGMSSARNVMRGTTWFLDFVGGQIFRFVRSRIGKRIRFRRSVSSVRRITLLLRSIGVKRGIFRIVRFLKDSVLKSVKLVKKVLRGSEGKKEIFANYSIVV